MNLLCSESDSRRPTQGVELILLSHELDMVWNQLKGALCFRQVRGGQQQKLLLLSAGAPIGGADFA